LKGKRERLSEQRSEMTGDQLKVLRGFIADAKRHVGNASLVLKEPSPEQAKDIDDALRELVERVEQIRQQLAGTYAR